MVGVKQRIYELSRLGGKEPGENMCLCFNYVTKDLRVVFTETVYEWPDHAQNVFYMKPKAYLYYLVETMYEHSLEYAYSKVNWDYQLRAMLLDLEEDEYDSDVPDSVIIQNAIARDDFDINDYTIDEINEAKNIVKFCMVNRYCPMVKQMIKAVISLGSYDTIVCLASVWKAGPQLDNWLKLFNKQMKMGHVPDLSAYDLDQPTDKERAKKKRADRRRELRANRQVSPKWIDLKPEAKCA